MSYGHICLYYPNHPWGTPNYPSLGTPTSTPLGQDLIKLNQSPAQIRGHFWAVSSRLGDSAPALLGAFLVLRDLVPQMLFFSLWPRLLVP